MTDERVRAIQLVQQVSLGGATLMAMLLAERESIERERRSAERRVKAAGSPVTKTLDAFSFAAQPSINQQLVRELMRGGYIDRHENVLLMGNSGTSRTRLATGLVTRLLERREQKVSFPKTHVSADVGSPRWCRTPSSARGMVSVRLQYECSGRDRYR